MTHPLVLQLRFARSEFRRGLEGLGDAEARRRFLPMNCISWNIGHLAWQEQRYWLYRGQGFYLKPEINELFAYGAPACEPDLDTAWTAWQAITAAADPWLDGLSGADLAQPRRFMLGGEEVTLTFGTMMLRTTYHYWYHLGESLAIRQMLGHADLPDFVGNIDDEAPYIREL